MLRRKKKLLFYIYAVIVKQKNYKRSTNHYSQLHIDTHRYTQKKSPESGRAKRTRTRDAEDTRKSGFEISCG
jgi:hypothetical protein